MEENWMPLFAVTLTFTDDVERRLEVRPTHREYLKELLAQGKLHESGPFVDDTGALLIYDAVILRKCRSYWRTIPTHPMASWRARRSTSGTG
jgi:uncharacterized protein YciI